MRACARWDAGLGLVRLIGLWLACALVLPAAGWASTGPGGSTAPGTGVTGSVAGGQPARLAETTTVSGWDSTPLTAAKGYQVSEPITVTTGAGFISRTIKVQQRLTSATDWTTVKTATTTATGRYTVRYTVPAPGTWQVRLSVTATATAAATTTAIRPVTSIAGEATTITGWPTGSATVVAGLAVNVPVVIATGTATAARAVSLQKVAVGGTAWTVIASGTSGADGAWTAAFTPTVGTYRYRLVVPATLTAAARTTPERTLTTASAPVLSAVTPASGSTEGGASVTLTGTGLTGATGVKFGTAAGTAVTVVSDTKLITTAPAASASGPVALTVTTPGGISNALTYTYLAPPPLPTISSILPANGRLAGGVRVTISGTNLADVTQVTFDGVPGSSLAVQSVTSLTVLTPARASGGIVRVVATSAAGSSASTPAARFTYVALPTISSVSPTTITRNAETKVTVTGTNLATTTSVAFGPVAAKSFVVVSDSLVEAITPVSGLRGGYNLTVATIGGTASSAVTFRDPSEVASPFTLTADESLTSPNGVYRLVMQGDGNLVLYRSGGVAVWASGTNGSNRHAVMQADGNLVVYTGATPLWSSNTTGFGSTRLTMQDDGNLVIYSGWRAIWCNGNILYNRLSQNQTLRVDESLLSSNRQYTLIMQGDGNLVLYRSGGGALWASNTSGAGNWAVLQGDGNFVVYTSANRALWATNTAGRTGTQLVVQDDSNLVLYSNGVAVWSRGGSAGGAIDDFRAWALNPANWNSTTDIGQRGIDFDGWYGAQCADIGIAWSAKVGRRVGFDGWDTSSASKPGWTPIVGTLAQARPGDVVTRVGGNRHVVVVVGNPSGTVPVLQQNPASPHVANYYTSTSGVIWRMN